MTYAIFDITLSSLGTFETFEDDEYQDLMVDTAKRKFWELA